VPAPEQVRDVTALIGVNREAAGSLDVGNAAGLIRLKAYR
jgi:hypothetical protein